MASGADPWQKLKEYGERVAKYIPAEVLAFYTGATQLILAKEGDAHKLLRLWLFGIIGLIAWFGTPALLGTYSKEVAIRVEGDQIRGFIVTHPIFEV